MRLIAAFRRLSMSLANHRASLSSELGSLWDFFRIDRERRRSAPASTPFDQIPPMDTKSPAKLARDLLQVVHETVFSKKFEEKRCPLVKEESDLSSDDEDGTERRIANLIDFFFTIVKSQKEERKGSGSCFKSEASPEDANNVYVPTKVNTELEHKMETLIEFLATTGCVEDNKEEKKITLMEFLFGTEERKLENPVIEINAKGISLSESNVNVKNLTFIDETPGDEGSETLVEMLLKYMEDYGGKEKETPKSLSVTQSLSVTPSLSEKSKSDMTISKFETISDMSKTKSDSTLTHTQDTVIDRGEFLNSERRVSETVFDLSNIKSDLEGIFEEAVLRVYELNMIFEDDTMSEQEDMENFTTYTKPPQVQYSQPYSVELSDILEEDEPEPSSMDNHMSQIRQCAEDLVKYIENKVQDHPFNDSSGPSTEEFSREFDLSPSQKSVSLVDLRNIPDLPPSMINKPKVLRVDKSTSTTEITESISEMCRRIDSACMTDDTISSSSERNERALDKLESLTRFFSRSRLEIIDESLEENGDKGPKSPNEGKTPKEDVRKSDMLGYKIGQASLDDVEDILDDNDRTDKDLDKTENLEKCTEDT
ncbi:uncharacterized protein LOC123878273 [Maniola jurtina]|uniref:uncharacterized protein LOC123878273 n=1 Tax=Maniola jurtina TaxID=191418 RepID=UPI001E688D0A|nr:uncharacterized protein LOC123878273 [Maniola jurtina]